MNVSRKTMTDQRRKEIVEECYEGTNGNYLLDGFDADQWRAIADDTGDDDAWETAFVLASVDEDGGKETLRKIDAGELK